jgi:hypothetical protein
MDFYSALFAQATPVEVEPSETSYFSAPLGGLDPRLFANGKLIPSIRASILRILIDHLKTVYSSPESYIHVWLAGSGVSYQWSAARNPADLDCLIGVNYLLFRQANQQYKALSDQQIADMINDDMREHLYPLTENFLGLFELTFYVNVRSDIRSIKPYAAYSLTNDDWTVQPELKAPPVNKAWDSKIAKDTSITKEIVQRYNKSLNDINAASNVTARRNAEAALKFAIEQGAALFEDIHSGRRSAFSPSGQGYSDIANYRWQAGKQAGTVQALKKLKDINTKGRKTFEEATYGMELPDVSLLVRRALTGNK